MKQQLYAKAPAFFGIIAFDAFFESEAAESDRILAALREDVDVDSELDAILAAD